MPVNPLVILLVNSVLFTIALLLAIPVTVLLIECVAALLPSRSEADIDSSPPRIAVLVPAHDEAAGIRIVLERLLPQLESQDRLVVIADNCSDETASIARTTGATVIERHDPDRRGKGYALDYGMRFLASDPPDVVAIVDADCVVQPGSLAQIARRADATGRPVQAVYLMERPAQPKPKDSVSALAFMVKNLVRPQGMNRLGLPCILTGTGMAFPWSVIGHVPLASSNLVEDMQLSVDLAIAGSPPLLCTNARVMGLLPQQQQAAKSQRTRWEHGHLQTLLTQVPRLLKAATEKKRLDLLAIALDLCIPPLSLLVMLWTVVMAAALLAGSLGFSWLSTLAVALEGMLLLIAVVSAWAKYGRVDLPALTLLAVPLYMLWKIPLYLAFIVRPQTKWVRTERDVATTPEP